MIIHNANASMKHSEFYIYFLNFLKCVPVLKIGPVKNYSAL